MLLPSLSYNSGVGWGAQEDFWRVEFTQGGVERTYWDRQKSPLRAGVPDQPTMSVCLGWDLEHWLYL